MRTLVLASSLLASSALILAGCGKEGATSSEDSDTINTTDGPGDTSMTSSGTDTGTEGATSERPTSSDTTSADATGTDATTSEGTTTSDATSESSSTSGPGTITNMTTNMTSDTSASDSSTGDTGGAVVPATAEDACAPNDGPAVEFKIDVVEAVCGADWAGDRLRIFVFEGAPLAPGSHSLGDFNGFATLQVGMGELLGANEGELVIESWDGETVTGSYTLTFMDDSMRAGSFSAVFCDTNPPCG